MLFQATITIPANTSKTAPTIQLMGIARGIISKFMVRPRMGHAGLAHLTVKHHEHQIAPSTPNMSISGDSYPIDWEDYYEVYQPPYHLKLTGWNLDDSYPHSFDVYVAIIPKKAVVATAVSDTLSNIVGLFTVKKVKK